MGGYFVTDSKEGEVAYKSVLVKDPSSLSALSNQLARKIIDELSKTPSCALDVARRLKLHEQKVYYHIRNLERAGIIKFVGTEERTGGTAKMYSVASPVISVKLFEHEPIKRTKSLNHSVKTLDFLKPFVENGKLNCKVVVGLPYKHGKYDATPRDCPYALDIAFFLGSFVSNVEFPCFVFDTEVRRKDLESNLIIVGGPKINTIAEKINDKLPIYFDAEKGFLIVSKKTNTSYKYDFDCVVVRMKSPFKEGKEIIFIAGKRSAGTISGVVAFTQHLNKLMKAAEDDKSFARVVTGYDKNGDGVIDSIKFLE